MNRQGAPPPFEQQVTFLYTADLEATDEFYVGLLGLPLVLDQGSCRIYRAAAGAFLGFCTRSAAVPAQGVILTLVSRRVDEWAAWLAARGVEIEKPPQHNPAFNIYHCFVRDPNGYLVEIQRFLDAAWPAVEVA